MAVVVRWSLVKNEQGKVRRGLLYEYSVRSRDELEEGIYVVPNGGRKYTVEMTAKFITVLTPLEPSPGYAPDSPANSP